MPLSIGIAVAASCAAPVDVVAVRSRQGTEPIELGTAGTAGALTMTPCTEIATEFIPEANADDEVNLEGWECGWLTAAVDPSQPGGATVELAVTLRRGANSGGRALFFNPGGPGGSGTESVWGLWDSLPTTVLDNYDIVGWDPRGVGSSRPRLGCPEGSSWDDSELMSECESVSSPLPGYMATVNTVADLEALRLAFEQDTLNYVGYSYGTYIGALYANAYPDRVGRFVLDGSVSPDSGTDRSPVSQGDAWYATDGYDDAVSRFEELCQVTNYCAIDDDPLGVVSEVADNASDLDVDNVPDNDGLSEDEVWDTFDAALEVPNSWGVLSVAFDRARDGDGSALAAMALTFDTDDGDDDDGDDRVTDDDNQRLANITVYCSDFADVDGRALWCDDVAENRYFGGTIGPVDTPVPIVVIGNEYDPATPLVHAREMRARLGDAVLVEWNGVGHTAFPGTSECVDDAIEAYLVDGVVPEDSLQCPFVDGIDDSDVGELGDYMFDLTPDWLTSLVEGTLYDQGLDETDCLATEIVAAGTDAAVDVFLEIDSSDAVAALDDAHSICD